jgi:hypothetical protein
MAAAGTAECVTEPDEWKPAAAKREVDWRRDIVDTAESTESE